jgi:hypothetical protein
VEPVPAVAVEPTPAPIPTPPPAPVAPVATGDAVFVEGGLAPSLPETPDSGHVDTVPGRGNGTNADEAATLTSQDLSSFIRP